MENSKKSEYVKSDKLTEIVWVHPKTLTIYGISEGDFEKLAHGNFGSIYLNFAIFLFSISIAFFIAIFTTTPSCIIYCIFLTLCILSSFNGIILLVLWNRERKSKKQLVESIKRPHPEGVQQPLPDSSK